MDTIRLTAGALREPKQLPLSRYTIREVMALETTMASMVELTAYLEHEGWGSTALK